MIEEWISAVSSSWSDNEQGSQSHDEGHRQNADERCAKSRQGQLIAQGKSGYEPDTKYE